VQATRARPAARRFVRSTFELIHAGKVNAIAPAFTFGHEDLIPDIFRKLVRGLNDQDSGRLSKFVWYLERHIEGDAQGHGPLARWMVANVWETTMSSGMKPRALQSPPS
jgi:hypothetical protein